MKIFTRRLFLIWCPNHKTNFFRISNFKSATNFYLAPSFFTASVGLSVSQWSINRQWRHQSTWRDATLTRRRSPPTSWPRRPSCSECLRPNRQHRSFRRRPQGPQRPTLSCRQCRRWRSWHWRWCCCWCGSLASRSSGWVRTANGWTSEVASSETSRRSCSRARVFSTAKNDYFQEFWISCPLNGRFIETINDINHSFWSIDDDYGWLVKLNI